MSSAISMIQIHTPTQVYTPKILEGWKRNFSYFLVYVRTSHSVTIYIRFKSRIQL